MKKLLLSLILSVMFIDFVPAETPSNNRLHGWWVKVANNSTVIMPSIQGKLIQVEKQKMYFSEDNYFFSASFSGEYVIRTNGGQYFEFNDGMVTTYHQRDNGEFFGLANTYHITIKGDSMHFYGFYVSPNNLLPTKNSRSASLQSSLIDEWWVRETPKVLEKTTKAGKAQTASIKWVEKQTAKSPGKKFLAAHPSFLSDSAICYGYISNFSELYSEPKIAYIALTATTSASVPIQSDGRFVFTVPLSQPKEMELIIDRTSVKLCFEPGRSLGIVLDSKDLFMFRGKSDSKRVQYYSAFSAKNK